MSKRVMWIGKNRYCATMTEAEFPCDDCDLKHKYCGRISALDCRALIAKKECWKLCKR